ncbi:YchF/TatD family DNA exonuclease [Pseudoalteromonas sp. N1230-9]|uniref:TatD family hydrolase n=1 Tax=Pseudoalteromonas sp. N1230-9 TaxID=2907156 RepID=UPI002B303006|nr:YchF/TatD family DNA exonuclease [Pseudoalteromonas sp. N1230-9]
MTIELVDAGVNLSNHQFDEHHDEVLQRAAQAGVKQMLLIGCDIQSSQASLQLAKRHSLLCTSGIHPHDAKTADISLEQQLTLLASHPEVVAIGECGLDYNRDFSPRDVQRAVLRRQLALAETLNMPVYLHERDASNDMLAILNEYNVKGVLHCFTGDELALQRYLEKGLYIGVTGWVCDERRGEQLQSLIPSIPLERLLIETDAPFLLPRTIKPKPKSRRNEPSYLTYVCQQIADLKGCEFTEVAKQTTLNFQQLFSVRG